MTASAQTCEEVKARLQQERHLTIPIKSEYADRWSFRSGDRIGVDLGCEKGNFDAVVFWVGLKPEQEFFDLVTRVGIAISGNSPSEVSSAVDQCLAKAALDKQGLAKLEQPVRMECEAYVEQGGGTLITVYAK
ncbi:hypothetical protein D9M70_298030 [compost metagenome]